jgi:hypothetical protein
MGRERTHRDSAAPKAETTDGTDCTDEARRKLVGVTSVISVKSVVEIFAGEQGLELVQCKDRKGKPG